MRTSQQSDLEESTINWRVIKQLFPYLFEFKARILIALSCLVITKLASVYLPFILKDIVDTLDLQQGKDVVYVPFILVGAYGIVRLAIVLFAEIRDTLFVKVTERAVRRIGLKVFRHLHQLDLDFHLNRETGGISRDIDRGTSGIGFLIKFMVFNIIPTLIEIILVITILWTNYGIYFAVVTLSSIILYIAFSVFATNKRTHYIRAVNQADSRSNTRAIDSLINYETVKYFTNEDFEADGYDKQLADWETAKLKNRLSLFALNGGQAFIISLSMTAMLALAAYEVTYGHMTLGDFVLINAFMMQLFIPLNFLGFVYREIKGSLTNIERMFNLALMVPKVIDDENALPLKVLKGEIEFNHVSFSYSKERPILHDISFSVQAGQKVAIVGESGSGKSTLVKLLFRFYDTNIGSIVIDGQNIKNVTQHTLRKSIGIVPQDTVLFNESLYKNVLYGDVTAEKLQVENAIKLSHLSTFIASIPKGIETVVGERGLKLSGGEKQRVAIARAILKNPPIMVFDEATSSLDSHSEQAILNAIKEVAKNHTSMVIAHRLSTVIDADNILVLNKGRLVEQGDHASLLTKKGYYYKMWQLQQST